MGRVRRIYLLASAQDLSALVRRLCRNAEWVPRACGSRLQRAEDMPGFQLQQIPLIPIQVLEDGNGAVGLGPGFPHERDSERRHAGMVSPEVVGVEKEEYPDARLAADS